MEITAITNLTDRIREQLPAELSTFLQTAGKAARGMGFKLYMVGGVVRDLLLGRPNLDIDLVVEGDAIRLAEELAQRKEGKLVPYPQFNTARIKWNGGSADLATARSEYYPVPGALPVVQPSTLTQDLLRRDFTINAMAVYLEPPDYGELVDLFGGRNDLREKLVRIIHPKSFQDDATRIWRAIRYEQRLDFMIEAETLTLLERDLRFLTTLSGDRIRHELELFLQEAEPEKPLRRADQLGVLGLVNPSLRTGERLETLFTQARGYVKTGSPPPGLYLALLFYPLSGPEMETVIRYLKLSKSISELTRASLALKARLAELAKPGLAPSRIYRLLHEYPQSAVTANLICSDIPEVRHYLELYLQELHCLQPLLTGEDLLRMGLPPGRQVGEMLDDLREARMDGWAATRQDEIKIVKKRLGNTGH